jgi:hypothetical protein
MSQVLTCHNAHTEFLRQFWSAVLPTPPGTLGAPTPEQKMTKARKMAKFLSLMKEKVDSVVQSAAQDPTVDTERVREVSAGRGRTCHITCLLPLGRHSLRLSKLQRKLWRSSLP